MSQFSDDTAVVQVEDKLWRGELCRGWRIGEVPNGGYVLAVAGRVLSQALPHRDPLAVNAFYLAPTGLGPIDCRVELLRHGRNTSHAQLRMYQQGELKVLVTAAYTELAALKGESWSAKSRPDYPGWQDCTPSGQDRVEFFRERVEVRLVSGAEVFTRKEPNGSGEFRGWIAHRDGAEPDTLSLLMFADAFAPPVFTIFGPLQWVPTVELTVQVRARPSPGPLQARFYSRHLTRGVIEEDGEFWDSAGQLVAISRREGRYSQIGLLQISRSEVPTGNKTFPRSGSIALFPGATASYRWSLPRACRSTHPPGALLVEPERSIRSGLRRRSRPLPRSRERRAFPRAPSPRHGWNRRSRACPGFP